MNKKIELEWNRWREQHLMDSDLTEELQQIQRDDDAIYDRFYKELEFGTGGLRGKLGVGTNRMNLYTVSKATQGYCNYLNHQGGSLSVAIAYDSRIKSHLFASRAAEVFAANGMHVYIYRELMPTPSLSFAVRHLSCTGGVVITASHNPAEYNGYKVYGGDGGQITSKMAKEIFDQIKEVRIFKDIRTIDFEQGVKQGRISYIDGEVVTAYINAVSAESLCKDVIDKDVSIVYTPLNGAGLYCITRALRENGFTNIHVVKEQEQPDGNFPTCPYPNPEIRKAMAYGIACAKQVKSDLLLATDPDCDRVGIAVRDGDEYVLLTGNEVGMLLLDYICKRRIALGTMPKSPVCVKTIVTIDMAKRIARDYGVEVIEVLTGFKYIGEQISLLEQAGEENRFILGFEESYGYLTGGFVRDKDAVNASLIICEMFAYYKTQGQSLIGVLEGLYGKYGYCLNSLRSYSFEGEDGFHKMQDIMVSIRKHSMGVLAGRKVEWISDYLQSFTRYATGEERPILLPISNVLKIGLEGEISLVIRPSGTEPKMKLYLSVTGENREWAKLEEERIAGIVEAAFGL